ncbi:MAG: Spy/CpxP family protein refolding chaperone [Wenzhouxiangella sp.]|nr:Spy/CpxP family protein refolding chaperone [Wenzhouxiangella sp.]MCH8476909.1 hypothetical protein [Wenzhouxiangella sp.]
MLIRISPKQLSALAVAALLAISGPALANRQAPSPERMADRMAERLELSDSQRDQIANLIEVEREQRRALRSEGERDRSAMRASRQALREEIRDVLTAEQAERLDAMKSDRKHRRHRHGGRYGKGHPMAGLDLTDEQRTAMREQMQAWRADGERPDGAAWRQAMSDILTPEQQAMLAERRHGKRGKRRSCDR